MKQFYLNLESHGVRLKALKKISRGHIDSIEEMSRSSTSVVFLLRQA